MKQIVLKVTIKIEDTDLADDYVEYLAIQDVKEFLPGTLGDGEVLVNSIEVEAQP
jgi:hypothetical protein